MNNSREISTNRVSQTNFGYETNTLGQGFDLYNCLYGLQVEQAQ